MVTEGKVDKGEQKEETEGWESVPKFAALFLKLLDLTTTVTTLN